MFIFKKLNILLLMIVFIFNSCTVLPGIIKSPKKTNPNKKMPSIDILVSKRIIIRISQPLHIEIITIKKISPLPSGSFFKLYFSFEKRNL